MSTGSSLAETSDINSSINRRKKFLNFIKSRYLEIIAIVSSILLALFIVGFFIKKPVVVVMPGDADDAADFVYLEGAEPFENEGEVFVTTTYVKQDPNIWEYLWVKYIDKDALILPEEDLYPQEQTEEENEEINRQDMINSQLLARAVALKKLGYNSFITKPIVAQVVKGSSADGLLRPNDIILKVDDVEFQNTEDLIDKIASYSPGDKIKLTIDRMHEEETEIINLDAVLGENPDDKTKPFLGVNLSDIVLLEEDDLGERIGFDIDIDTDDIGGPSAGLALTIEILDILTEGDMLNGQKMAFTGTINFDGQVGPIGGMPQKAVAVKKSGIDYFIVPAYLPDEDFAEAERLAGDELEIIPVETLDEALDVIEDLGGDISNINDQAIDKIRLD